MRGVSERTVQRDWRKARLLLHRVMRDDPEDDVTGGLAEVATARTVGESRHRRRCRVFDLVSDCSGERPDIPVAPLAPVHRMFSLKRHFWNALQPLLDRALDLEPSQRRAWLDDLRTDCPTIARELERLMRPELDSSDPASFATRDVLPGSLESLGLRG